MCVRNSPTRSRRALARVVSHRGRQRAPVRVPPQRIGRRDPARRISAVASARLWGPRRTRGPLLRSARPPPDAQRSLPPTRPGASACPGPGSAPACIPREAPRPAGAHLSARSPHRSQGRPRLLRVLTGQRPAATLRQLKAPRRRGDRPTRPPEVHRQFRRALQRGDTGTPGLQRPRRAVARHDLAGDEGTITGGECTRHQSTRYLTAN